MPTCRNNDHYVGVESSHGGEIAGSKIVLQHTFTTKMISIQFNEMKIDVSMTKVYLIAFNIGGIQRYMVVLLELSTYGYKSIDCKLVYYVIDSDWIEMDDKMKMRTHISPGCKY